MYDFRRRNILVAGGTGMIGRQLVELLLQEEAYIRIASLDDPSLADPRAEFVQCDLTYQENCMGVCRDMDYIFNLLAVKGSPDANKRFPATLFRTNLLLELCLLEAAHKCGVQGFMQASSLGAYPSADVFYEDDMWSGLPPLEERAGMAKKMGEYYAELCRIEYAFENISIVRPANTYGPYDDFISRGAMVIPTKIRQVVDKEDLLVCWGDGSQVRDFIYSRDVAEGMLHVAKLSYKKPVNLGSGTGVTIRELIALVCSVAEEIGLSTPRVIWDMAMSTGDMKRILNISRARSIGFEPRTSLRNGIKHTMLWYLEQKKESILKRFNALSRP